MPEDETLSALIRSLLEKAQQSSETVQELAFDCLRQFRKECGIILEWSQQDTAHSLLTTGSNEEGLDNVAREWDERLDELRRRLKERLEALLKTATEKGL